MKASGLLIGNTQAPNNVFLAPMAGYTDYAFRKLALSLGIGLAFTELVSAKGLMYGGNGSKDLLFCGSFVIIDAKTAQRRACYVSGIYPGNRGFSVGHPHE